MRHLVYAGIGSRATPRAVLETMTVMAAWLARKGWHLPHRRGGRGRHGVRGGGPCRPADPVPAVVRLPGKRRARLPHALGGTAAPLSLDRLGPASRLAPLLARGTEASR